MLTKNDLRIAYKTLRLQLTEDQIAEKSLAIANRLLQIDIWERDFYHIFLPIARQNEVDTELILHLLSGKDKHIVISRSDFQTREMTHFLLTDNTKIIPTSYGIPEPESGIGIPADKIDVVFVPLLCFDEAGNRVGYGKGFYDKFLANCRPETIKIGLSFFEAVEPWEDVFESDVKLDFCVTPDQVYEF
ncbi:5-formyltetrahydrofolate cyclo-ligase [Flavobacterium selenitireducens]|uniref:5-formyltetrahydrofolate cyclo-ligase n=1 Tax=Flavobacterium selenitireducens TaxID=2722704 RepID=UPI00168B21CD|nr:5-formyltetrahydrofolate cyclo-ligase [Flavobacterium selenitireducens]MBD3582078.1 5-formyltetrahydrofolate cyclo-ligase [Flavobacterium selenitireducens]